MKTHCSVSELFCHALHESGIESCDIPYSGKHTVGFVSGAVATIKEQRLLAFNVAPTGVERQPVELLRKGDRASHGVKVFDEFVLPGATVREKLCVGADSTYTYHLRILPPTGTIKPEKHCLVPGAINPCSLATAVAQRST